MKKSTEGPLQSDLRPRPSCANATLPGRPRGRRRASRRAWYAGATDDRLRGRAEGLRAAVTSAIGAAMIGWYGSDRCSVT